jgi:hypothetical protein
MSVKGNGVWRGKQWGREKGYQGVDKREVHKIAQKTPQNAH